MRLMTPEVEISNLIDSQKHLQLGLDQLRITWGKKCYLLRLEWVEIDFPNRTDARIAEFVIEFDAVPLVLHDEKGIKDEELFDVGAGIELTHYAYAFYSDPNGLVVVKQRFENGRLKMEA